MASIRMESCTLEIDGRSLLAARSKAKIIVSEVRVIVPLSLISSAVRAQLPGFSLAIQSGEVKPRVEFAGEFEADEVMPGWMGKMMPDSMDGKLRVSGMLELQTTPTGGLQVVVMSAAVAGMKVPKALNIQRFILDRVRNHISASSFLKKGSGDALFEIDLPHIAKRANVELELPKTSSVALSGDEIVVSYGAAASSTVRAPSASARQSAPSVARRPSATAPKRSPAPPAAAPGSRTTKKK